MSLVKGLLDTAPMVGHVSPNELVANYMEVKPVFEYLFRKYRTGFEKMAPMYMDMQKQVIPETMTTSFMRNKIVNYKLKMAQKSNKKVKNNPADMAFLDISDAVMDTLNDFGNLETMDNTPDVTYTEALDGIVFRAELDGNICLPFTECFIGSTALASNGICLQIKDNKDGTYTGNVWAFLNIPYVTQFKLDIGKYNGKWCIHMKFPYKQKPLGQVADNVNTLIIWFFVYHLALEGYRMPADLLNAGVTELGVDMVHAMNIFATSVVVNILKYLGSYKSKTLYKVSKEDNIYVYTTKAKEEVEKYLELHYSNHIIEKQDGWLVNGYWKLLKDNEYGLDQDGKKIKGFDWCIPYKEDTKELVTSGNQETNFVINHAIKRVKERYNVQLDSTQIEEMAKLCQEGNAVRLSVRDKFGRIYDKKGSNSNCYRIKYNKNYYDVVGGYDKDGCFRIRTFLPKPKDVNYRIINCKSYDEIFKG